MLLDKFENKYIVEGTIKAEAPIHIGTGDQQLDPLQMDNAIIRDENGKPYIPGSSLKGVLRSYMEFILSSGIDSNYTSCLIVNSPCDGSNKEKIKKIRESYEKDKEIADKIYDSMCDVCKLFGGLYFTSKIQISDCKLSSDIAYVEKRDCVAIDRETGTEFHKYDFEQVAIGTEFKFYMTIDNLDSQHEELIKLIINVLKNGELKVGGKTTKGLGNIRLIKEHIYKITKKNLKEYVFNGVKEEMRWNNV